MKKPKCSYLLANLTVEVSPPPTLGVPSSEQHRVYNWKRKWHVDRFDGELGYVAEKDRTMRRLCISMARAEAKRIARL